MDPNNLFINFITFFLLLAAETALSADYHFKACKSVLTCGSGPNISYPFWIQGQQPSFCGYPGFNISCKNKNPVLKISGNEYVIHHIDSSSQTLTVSNFEASANSCVVPVNHNLTFNQTPFQLGDAHLDMFLFFNCSAASLPNRNLPYFIDCPGGRNSTNHRSSLAFFGHDNRDSNDVKQSGKCESLVIAPIDSSWNDSISGIVNRNYSYIMELLNKGFILTWKASRCEICEGSGGRCGFNYSLYIFQCFCPDRAHSKHCHGGMVPNVRKKLAIGLGAGAGGVLLASLVFFIYLIRNKKVSSFSTCFLDKSSDPTSNMDLENYSTTYYGVHVFTYTELKDATNNFDASKELGDGGFGTVYHGKLLDGRAVAVKRMYKSNYKRFEQFHNEVEILARLRHQNLVSLYGCTSRQSHELLLVYEFVPNGTVADHLHGERSKAGLLTWPIRMRISIETASTLAYLHASDIIHRDIKTTNILLDSNFSVKVADFGLSCPFPTDVTHISTAPQGTPGYVDPKYYQCYQLTSKSDVYSFGVVLFELISSKPAVDISRHQHEINLSNMAINKIQNGALHELVDPSLGFESDRNARRRITLVSELAFRCLQQEKEMRPSMEEVLQILKGIESDQYKAEKQVEMDVPADDISLPDNPQLSSPDLMTDKCIEIPTTTPNTIV